jgi:hypothetical protein
VPDLRYHLISLISVFLALAIGVLLGVAMADRGVVSARVQAEITSIEQQLDRQQREIDEQNEQIGDQEAMLERMSEVMVSGSLQGAEVALVSGPYADPDVSEAVQSDLTEAGASIITVESLEPPEPAEITRFENASPQAMTPLEDEYVGFAREIAGFTGEVESAPEIVIFVGGGEIPEGAPPDTRAVLDTAQAEMFGVWLDAGVRVVGAEPLRPGHSDVELFQDVGIPSAVNADEPAGRAALIVCATAANCEGTYGTKETATDLFPSPG